MKERVVLGVKGFAMGTADIIPGVSGGTVAFITGIYEQLIDAIRSVNIDVIKDLATLNLTSALAAVHLKFLLPLLAGIALAVVSTARLMHHLLHNYPVEIWSLFFGLIAASILMVASHIGNKKAGTWIAVAAGAVIAWLITGLIPVDTPETWWFVLLCGMIAICAMILPGISGAFLLLILGKYEYITGAIKNPFELANIGIIAVFLLGCTVGIMGFSRVLHWLLQKKHDLTIALLTGFMIGAMRKVWPWKETLESKVIRGKEYILREANVLPDMSEPNFFIAIGLMAAGFVFVLLLERVVSGEK
jgi:putative membrane protein